MATLSIVFVGGAQPLSSPASVAVTPHQKAPGRLWGPPKSGGAEAGVCPRIAGSSRASALRRADRGAGEVSTHLSEWGLGVRPCAASPLRTDGGGGGGNSLGVPPAGRPHAKPLPGTCTLLCQILLRARQMDGPSSVHPSTHLASGIGGTRSQDPPQWRRECKMGQLRWEAVWRFPQKVRRGTAAGPGLTPFRSTRMRCYRTELVCVSISLW